MKPIDRLFCKSVQEMSPYSPIEPPDQIARRLNLPEEQIIKLDANENPFGTAPEVLEALRNGRYYHIYPDPAQVNLRQAIAGYADCSPDMVVAGTGADELIDIACRLLLETGEKVISFAPTFSYYGHVVALNKGRFCSYPRESDFSISLEKARQIDLTGVKLVILCSPNNPTGNLLEEAVLDYFLDQEVVVLVDEAYFEFSQSSFLNKVKDRDNLLILRTFSKCFALAGLRVGYGIMSATLASGFMRIKPPFSVNVAAEIALETCLSNLSHFQKQVTDIQQIRDWTQKELSGFQQLRVWPSQSNFILCQVLDIPAVTIYEKLQQKGILVRYFATDLLQSFIRISVGTQSQMAVFLDHLRQLIQ
ncbi:MAG: histidinol-phosphate transaminase [bacterium]